MCGRVPRSLTARWRERSVRGGSACGAAPQETAVFVPAADAANEDDGYLLSVVSDLEQDASHLLVLEASGLDRVATVHLPRRVPAGIRGSWIPDSALSDTEA
ncbi:carotenoid oxygenase family protein [Streptomyces sp. NPDC055607]